MTEQNLQQFKQVKHDNGSIKPLKNYILFKTCQSKYKNENQTTAIEHIITNTNRPFDHAAREAVQLVGNTYQ